MLGPVLQRGIHYLKYQNQKFLWDRRSLSVKSTLCFSRFVNNLWLLFGISYGDAQIKIWGILNGQIQIEFADIISTDATNLYNKPERGHLSVDYTCLKMVVSGQQDKEKGSFNVRY